MHLKTHIDGITPGYRIDPALHARTGMGGSMLARMWHEFISRVSTYLKYQGLVSAMELISMHMESRYPTVYTLY